jgi:tetratricopeptide (TPR) repeat protein
LTRDYYQPFLSVRFPQSQWFKLSSQIPGHNSPYLPAIFPIAPDNRQIFQEDWKNYYLAVQKLNLQTLNLSQGKDRLGILEGYLNLQPNLPADSYLQSLLVEKLLSCYFWEKTFHPKDPDPGSLRLCQAVQKCLSRAYSIGYLYVKAGYFFDAEGEKNQARRAFEKALKLDPANSEIQQMLEKL